jgi:hypothetical protein
MKNFINFITETSKPVMKYYAYDWDDNILNMPTVIHMKHLVDGEWVNEDVSTSKYAKIRKSDKWMDYEDSYVEFRDYGPRGKNAFIEDCKIAIQNKNYGPVWNSFLKTLIKGSIFAIITARGHEPSTIKSVIKYIINNELTIEEKNEMISNLIAFQDLFTDNFNIISDIDPNYLIDSYLDKCDFIGISSPSFEKKHKISGGVSNPERLKIIALKEFTEKINKYGNQINGDISLGFSDDDIKTVNAVHKYFNELSTLYNINFNVFDTSNPKNIIKK